MTAVLLTVLMATALVRLTMQVVAGDLLHAARYPADPVDTMAGDLLSGVDTMLSTTGTTWQAEPHLIRWEQEMRT